MLEDIDPQMKDEKFQNSNDENSFPFRQWNDGQFWHQSYGKYLQLQHSIDRMNIFAVSTCWLLHCGKVLESQNFRHSNDGKHTQFQHFHRSILTSLENIYNLITRMMEIISLQHAIDTIDLQFKHYDDSTQITNYICNFKIFGTRMMENIRIWTPNYMKLLQYCNLNISTHE